MDLIPLNKKILPHPFGFRNMGATCYFNSLVQSLLACTSLTETMIENRNEPEYRSNIVARVYTQLLDKINNRLLSTQEKSSSLMEMSPLLWFAIMEYLKSKNSQSQFGHGQEDSHESFKMLMECWEDLHDVIRLFTHKDHVSIYCTECKQWNNSQTEDANNKNSSNEIMTYYELPKGLRSEIPPELEKLIHSQYRENGTIESFLNRQISYIGYGYRCNNYRKEMYDYDDKGCRVLKNFPCKCRCSDERKKAAINCSCSSDELKANNGICKDICTCPCYCPPTVIEGKSTQQCRYRCNSKTPKLKTVTMKIIPEILFCMCPIKAFVKYNENFPDILEFKTTVGITKYQAVSQIIHSGNAQGGHYWANALRQTPDGIKWFELNDGSFNEIEGFRPNDGTYVVIYHITR